MIKKMTEAGLGMVTDTVDVLLNATGKMVSGCLKKNEGERTAEASKENSRDESTAEVKALQVEECVTEESAQEIL